MLDSATLEQYISRLLETPCGIAESPTDIVRELLEQRYLKTNVERELVEVVNAYCAITAHCKSKLHHRSMELLKQVKVHLNRLQLHLMRAQLQQGFSFRLIENKEQKFVEMYFNSAPNLMEQVSYLIILLETEDVGKNLVANICDENRAVLKTIEDAKERKNLGIRFEMEMR